MQHKSTKARLVITAPPDFPSHSVCASNPARPPGDTNREQVLDFEDDYPRLGFAVPEPSEGTASAARCQRAH